MAESLHNLADRFTKSTTTAIQGIHGTGDAIRGTINSSIDGLVPNHESKEGSGRVRNEDIARRGMGEMKGAENYFRGDGGTPRSQGHGGWTDAASAGAGGGWAGASLGNLQRQERERERLWEQERRERELDIQKQQQQQQFHQPPQPPVHQQYPQSQQSSAPPSANAGLVGQQPQGQGFRNGHSLRNGSGSAAGHGNGLGQKIFHHQKTSVGGEGKWLSQGGVREMDHDGQNVGQPQPDHQQTGYSPGAGAARLAWTGGPR